MKMKMNMKDKEKKMSSPRTPCTQRKILDLERQILKDAAETSKEGAG